MQWISEGRCGQRSLFLFFSRALGTVGSVSETRANKRERVRDEEKIES